MKLYMKVTKDEYELPLAVAESASELGRMVGTSGSVVLSSISHHRPGWVRIEVDDSCEEDYECENSSL